MKDNYYHTKETVKEYIQLAKDVSGENHINRLRTYLDPNAQILELGSGPGTDYALLNQNYEVVGSDLSDEFLLHLKRNYPLGSFLKLDAITLDTNELFDAIYSNKVLHHLRIEELEQSLTRQLDVLKPGGLICHSFWKGDGDEIFKGMYVKYHKEVDIQKLVDAYYDILVLEGYAEFERDDSILLIARKK